MQIIKFKLKRPIQFQLVQKPRWNRALTDKNKNIEHPN